MSRWSEARERFQSLVEEYGPIALIVHFTLFFGVLLPAWAAISAGMDLGTEGPAREGIGGWLLSTFGLELGLAYAFSQATKPVRLVMVVALTPVVARFFGHQGADTDGAEPEAGET